MRPAEQFVEREQTRYDRIWDFVFALSWMEYRDANTAAKDADAAVRTLQKLGRAK